MYEEPEGGIAAGGCRPICTWRRSTIRAVFGSSQDRNALAQLRAGETPVLAPRSEATESRLHAVEKLVAEARSYVAEAEKANAEVAKLAQPSSRTPEAVKRAQGQINAQAEKAKRLLALIEAVARSRAKAKGITADADVDDFIAKVTTPLLTDDAGRDVTLNVEEFARFLNEEKSFVESQLAVDEAAASRAGTARLRIRAFVKTPSSELAAVHVTNYDDIVESAPQNARG